MSARKTTRKKTSNVRARARRTIDVNLRDLEKRLPQNMRGIVREVRANLHRVQQQMDKARREREQRWRRLEEEIRGEIAKLLRRLEKAVATNTPARTKTRRKKPARRKTAGVRAAEQHPGES